MVLFLSANRLSKQFINKKMEFQQMSDEKNFKMQVEDDKKIEFQYMDFYANFEIVDSDQVSSDLDDLQAFHENLEANRYDICCRNEQERDEIRRNSRVAEIPTVYLISCIRTQHLPEKRDWPVDSQQETKEEQTNPHDDFEDISGKLYKLAPDEDNRINSKSVASRILKPMSYGADTDGNRRPLINTNKKNKLIKVCSISERPWKTDYMEIHAERFWEKQNKEKKLMHNSKKPKQNKGSQNKVKKKPISENSVSNLNDNSGHLPEMRKKFDEILCMRKMFQQICEEHEQKNHKLLGDRGSRNASITSKHNQKVFSRELSKIITVKLEHLRYLNPSQSNFESPTFRTQQHPSNGKVSRYKQKADRFLYSGLVCQSLIQGKRPRPSLGEAVNNQLNLGEKWKNKYRRADEINQNSDIHKQKL